MPPPPPTSDPHRSDATQPRRPTVAIVGRPNVGKSTLFNRLTGTRDALVSDLPGLTRDRKEGEADVMGNPVTIVDTAGLEDADRGSIADRMRRQTETALRAADLILFVIDARAGVTPTDETFAELARQSGTTVILVANKCEGRKGDAGVIDAYALGFGDPVAVSAEHGEGLDDLDAAILRELGLKPPQAKRRRGGRARYDDLDDDGPVPIDDDAIHVVEGDMSDSDAPAADPERPIKLAIVGRPNAGKSTLVNALLGEDRMITGPEPGLTRDSVASPFVWQGRNITLYDTAGLRRKARITETAEKLSASDSVRALRYAEVVVLLVDAANPFEHQDMTIADMAIEEGRALVVAVNKWDTVEDKQAKLKDMKEDLAERLSQAQGIAMVPISALAEKNLDKLMAAVITTYDTWNRRLPTSALNRWLIEATQRHAPPAASGRRVKLRYITQTTARPPTFVTFCSKPEEIPKSYIRYLVNSLREAFDMPGVPIRFQLRKSDNPYAER
jgi:GTP-binding protein